MDLQENSVANSSRVSQMQLIQKESLELFKRKNQDYGDAFANYGAVGVLIRMGDKIARLQSITNKSVSLINSESLRDTLIDLHNYSAMAIMLLDEDEDEDEDEDKEKITTKTSYPNPPPPTPRSNHRPKW